MCFYRKLLFVFILVISFPNIVLAEVDNSWLVGVWKLSGDSKDEFLEFKAGMTCALVSGKGRKISGDYELTDSKIKIVYNFKGKKIPIDLSYDSSREKLSGNLSNTGKTVQYVRK